MLKVQGSLLKAHCSRLIAQGSLLKARGPTNNATQLRKKLPISPKKQRLSSRYDRNRVVMSAGLFSSF
jgi:hypothetical protein